jgi:hypothetical protein
MPKRTNARRSTCSRNLTNRTAVPTTWGIDTAATATFVPKCAARSGVSRLPIPNPLTAATAPATVAARRTAASKITTT